MDDFAAFAWSVLRWFASSALKFLSNIAVRIGRAPRDDRVAINWSARAWSKGTREAISVAISLAMHVFILLALIGSVFGRQAGLVEGDLGGGRPNAILGESYNYVTISLAKSTLSGQGNSTNASAEATAQSIAPTLPPGATTKADGLPASERSMPVSILQAPATDAQLVSLAGEPAPAAAANGAVNLPVVEQAGDPGGRQNLLRQIARCLPSGRHPALKTTKLTIQLDSEGKLRAPPTVDLPRPLVSKDVIESADQVVQAALQCGPYKVGTIASVFELVADFSFLDTAAYVSARDGPSQ